ncbi:MAG: B12-binding domain-containing radical SAM protein, partial [Muribaculaceae bacterium]|nr:B12-binding domain-containing radical SAM protein [Muribaculaceae bacterium]
MRITFLVPPCYDHSQPAERSAGCTRVVYPMPNIYELTVAACLRDGAGHDVRYEDFVFKGKNISQFKKFIESDNSEAYLIWTVNLSIESDLMAIADIRSYHPETPIILMGPGATFFTSKCLVDPYIFIVRGEPDETVIELISALEQQQPITEIAGISYLENGKIVNNRPRKLIQNLDSLPFPARDLVKDQKYHNPKLKTGPYTTMFTSRNCPYQCIYCVPSSLSFAREIEFGKEHQGRKPTIGFRSLESVEKEVAQLAAEGYKAIGFMDDNFIWNEERTRGLCDILKKYNMAWGCEARVDAITEPIAKMLGESGCRYVDLGVESFNQEILDYVKKGIKIEDIHNAVKLLKKYNVPVKLNILIGSSPLETPET